MGIARHLKHRCLAMRAAEKLGKLSICPVSRMELWANWRTRHEVTQKTEACLGLAFRKLRSEEKAIHNNLPVSSTVQNPKDVFAALASSRFRYMLSDDVNLTDRLERESC